ncbi:hypothetical protein [Marinimicrobium locisalis]|uniref:hypothetical protein n=1 Tax=Marinimicrobium locisalis TaxID=546022 RepID=UPI003221EBB5
MAHVTGRAVVVSEFHALDSKYPSILKATLDTEITKLWPSDSRLPYTLYGVDTTGKVWAIEFGARNDDTPHSNNLFPQPRLTPIGHTIKAPIRHVVVLRRQLILQTQKRRGDYELWSVERRSGQPQYLGAWNLDSDITALDPTEHDILLGRQKGEQVVLLLEPDSARGEAALQRFDMGRVSATTVLDGSRVLLAQKGGRLEKADLRMALPTITDKHASPVEGDCHVLRAVLERCGCDCCGVNDKDEGDRSEDEPPDDCETRHSAQLGFTPHRLYRNGSHLLAVSKGGTRMAVLDRNLNIHFERRISRAGAEVQAGQSHTQNILVHLAEKHQVETWRLDDYVFEHNRQRPDIWKEALRPALPSVTYWGKRNPRAAVNPTLKIGLFPVIDSGQTYGDDDMTELIDQVSAKIFSTVDSYYDECSYGELSIDFVVFGHHIGGRRKPLVLPRPQADYWYDNFRPGGLEAVMPAQWTDPVLFDGTETLQIQANPRAGAVNTYDLPFAALWTSSTLGNFPVTLSFTGSETLELSVETQTGDSHRLNLSFPATTLTVNQGGDIGDFLDELATLVTDAIRDAESALPDSPTLIQDVSFRRIRTSSNDSVFGRLQGQLRIAPSSSAATQKGRIEVSGPSMPAAPLAAIGLSAASIPGVMDSLSSVSDYHRECLRAAQADAGEGPAGDTEYFYTQVSTDYDSSAQTVTIGINLTADTGGKRADMEVVSSSALTGTGWDTASPNPGSQSGPNNRNTLRDSIELADDTFTAALDHLRATGSWSRTAAESMFENFDVMMIAHVGAPHPGIPAADRWDCDAPAGFNRKRMYARRHYATDQNAPSGEEPVQMNTSVIIGQEFNDFRSPAMTHHAGVMAHEIGHAIDLPDLYEENGFRDDVAYVDPWAMMGGGNHYFHHFCGWSKWSLGWIPDEPDPEVNRTIFVDLPSPSETSVTEAWLVPIEYWDDALGDDVRGEVGDSVPIGQLMKLNLGSDGGVTAFLELRAEGSSFSKNLTHEPTVIATNGLDPASDRHWAVNGLYRRKVHLLNSGTELRNVNDKWSFASAPEFPVKGCTAEVAEIRSVRGNIPIYRLRVEREQAEYIDLHFQDHVPSWKSPDIWVDWPGDNPDPNVPREYPVGTPIDQGEPVRFPASGSERHFMVARVHNAGNVSAEDVKVRWFVCDPPGTGDDGRWAERDTQTIAEIAPGDNNIATFDWPVDSSTNAHQCMRMEIIDWSIPTQVDPATGDTVALASDDVKLQNNNAQQNVFNFEALSGSPYAPISFAMQVHSDRREPEVASLVPDHLPHGAKLTISPREQTIPPGQARVFNCTLTLDEDIIRPGCDNDSGFLLSTWRRGAEADEIWGSCFYHIRPRHRTAIEITRTSWFNSQVQLYGRFSIKTDAYIDLADSMPLTARIRLLPDAPELEPIWRTAVIQPDGSFTLQDVVEVSKNMTAQAWFDRTDRLGSAVSKVVHIKQALLE